jgi:lipopolysaccharide/colanic/teichoic acid biosynthesis glycosyltransferase
MNQLSSVNTCRLHSLTGSEGIPRWKRALDIFCIILALPVWGGVGLVVAAIIKIVSPGPIFFRQERIGYLGRPFLCFKFRTMFVNSDTGIHKGHLADLITSNRPMNKLDGRDPRVIPFGIWLRALGLDELPQLINILRGEMSLVGPRPCVSYEYEKYLPCHRGRCTTLPGLTGLWQVSGKNNTTFEEMIDLDLHYAQHKTLWLDLSIILRTIPAIIIQTIETKRKKKASDSLVRIPTRPPEPSVDQRP